MAKAIPWLTSGSERPQQHFADSRSGQLAFLATMGAGLNLLPCGSAEASGHLSVGFHRSL